MSSGFDHHELSGLDPLDGGAGPAASISDERARALVRGVVFHQQPGRALPGKLTQAAATRRWPRWARTSALVLAAAGAASAAAAYTGSWPIEWPFARSDEPVSAPAAPASPAAHAREQVAEAPLASAPARLEGASKEGVSVEAGSLEAASLEATSLEAASRAEPSAPEQRVTARSSRRRLEVMRRAPSERSAATSAPAPSEPAARPEPSEPTSAPQAAGTLARANAARGARRYSEALSLYSSVIEEYPGTTQAHVARVAAAALALEHSRDPARAERLYEEAARGGGELVAEARYGIAESRRALGDQAGERAALAEFLRRHPSHALARVARQRWEELAR